MVMRHKMVDFITAPAQSRARIKQDGTKYRTICGACNSKLGGDYDRELVKLATFTISAGGNLVRDFDLSFSIRPERVIRAVIGHLVAGTEQSYLSVFDEMAQKYVFDKDARLPANYKVYYWIHRFPSTAIIRDTVMMWLDQNKPVLSHVLKFYPLGFLVAQDGTLPSDLGIPTLETCGLDEQKSISSPPVSDRPYWPEAPDNRHVLLGGEGFADGTYAVPRLK